MGELLKLRGGGLIFFSAGGGVIFQNRGVLSKIFSRISKGNTNKRKYRKVGHFYQFFVFDHILKEINIDIFAGGGFFFQPIR